LILLRNVHLVGVSLFGEKQPAVVCELLFPGVAGDQGKEVRGASVILWAKYAPEPLGFFLT
jgi:hypothetical protein